LEALQQTRLADEVLLVVRDTDAETDIPRSVQSNLLPLRTVTLSVRQAALNTGLDAAQGISQLLTTMLHLTAIGWHTSRLTFCQIVVWAV